MKTIALAALLGVAFWQTACRQTGENTALIAIVDLTGSVPAEAQSQALKVLQETSAGLQRGDTLIVIPLVGDALTETPGRVLRFTLSERRQAYDQDRADLKTEIARRLQDLQRQAALAPAKSTDLLGAFRLAAEEAQRQAQTTQAKNRKLQARIVALSDFIQDDINGLDFKRDPRLANPEAARKFVAEATEQSPADLQGVAVLLGSLRSDDLKPLNPERREALRVFWTEYCRAARAASVSFAADGIGALSQK